MRTIKIDGRWAYVMAIDHCYKSITILYISSKVANRCAEYQRIDQVHILATNRNQQEISDYEKQVTQLGAFGTVC